MAFALTACPKPTPAVVRRVRTQRTRIALDRLAKAAVRARDREQCRICCRHTADVHERVFKSRGGVASLDNSMSCCWTCHRLIHGHAIHVRGATCDGPLTFAMSRATARLVCAGRRRPPHITVTP